eukprot:3202776-Rhodomonas_salina.1
MLLDSDFETPESSSYFQIFAEITSLPSITLDAMCRILAQLETSRSWSRAKKASLSTSSVSSSEARSPTTTSPLQALTCKKRPQSTSPPVWRGAGSVSVA